jgi:hypothetical protein
MSTFSAADKNHLSKFLFSIVLECPTLLGPVYAMLEARTKHYGTLLLLKGKLDMMTRQIVAPADDLNSALPSKEALLGKYSLSIIIIVC